MPTEDYLSLIELDVDLKQISLVFNYEKMMMMILLTAHCSQNLSTACSPNPHRTYCRNTRRCQLYARCARPHADGRPSCTPQRRWTPGVHAPQGGVHGRTWACMGVHPTLYSKMSGWCWRCLLLVMMHAHFRVMLA